MNLISSYVVSKFRLLNGDLAGPRNRQLEYRLEGGESSIWTSKLVMVSVIKGGKSSFRTLIRVRLSATRPALLNQCTGHLNLIFDQQPGKAVANATRPSIHDRSQSGSRVLSTYSNSSIVHLAHQPGLRFNMNVPIKTFQHDHLSVFSAMGDSTWPAVGPPPPQPNLNQSNLTPS